jgi:hypothetical protein
MSDLLIVERCLGPTGRLYIEGLPMIPGGNFFAGLPVLMSVSLSPSSLIAGGNSTGTVTLDRPAPPGGAVVALSSNDGHAVPPANVTVPDGAISANFTVTTNSTTSTVTPTITASYGDGPSKTAGLTITSNLFTFTYASNTSNRNINADAVAAGWNGADPLKVTINSGIVISSSSTAVPALDTGSIGSSIPLSIVNLGTIVGRGGNGGVGGNVSPPADGSPGGAGGPALAISTACPITITNGSGLIYGGGGGGAGGGGGMDSTGVDAMGGGGGGGGYGGGTGGGTFNYGSPVSGSPGTTTSAGAGGAGGTGGIDGFAGPGGNGGDHGTAGSGGGGGLWTGEYSTSGGVGGAAGKAINLNGHSSPAFVSGGAAPQIQGAIA